MNYLYYCWSLAVSAATTFSRINYINRYYMIVFMLQKKLLIYIPLFSRRCMNCYAFVHFWLCIIHFVSFLIWLLFEGNAEQCEKAFIHRRRFWPYIQGKLRCWNHEIQSTVPIFPLIIPKLLNDDEFSFKRIVPLINKFK